MVPCHLSRRSTRRLTQLPLSFSFKGTGPIKHPGNVRYRCIVEKHVQQYFREEAHSQNDIEKLDVPFRSLAYKVIREVKERDGRFLQLSKKVDGDKHTRTSLEEVSISKAILKVMHALRHQVKLEQKANEPLWWAAPPRSSDAELSSTLEGRQVSISSDDTSCTRDVSSSSNSSPATTPNEVGEESNTSSSQAADMHSTLSNPALLSRPSSALTTVLPLAPASWLCCDDPPRTTISCTTTTLEKAQTTRTASLNKEEVLRAREQMLLRAAALAYSSSFQVAERRHPEHPVWLRRDLVLATMHRCRHRHEQELLLLLRQQKAHQILLGSISRSNSYPRDGREKRTR